MPAVYRPIYICKNVQLATSALTLAIHIFFKPCHSEFVIFHKKWCFKPNISIQVILYSNFLFVKLYLIFRKIILYFKIDLGQHW